MDILKTILLKEVPVQYMSKENLQTTHLQRNFIEIMRKLQVEAQYFSSPCLKTINLKAFSDTIRRLTVQESFFTIKQTTIGSAVISDSMWHSPVEEQCFSIAPQMAITSQVISSITLL